MENKKRCSILLFSVVGAVFSMPLDALLFLMDPLNHQINCVFKETENIFTSKTALSVFYPQSQIICNLMRI